MAHCLTSAPPPPVPLSSSQTPFSLTDTTMQHVKLNNGTLMPIVGLGTWQSKAGEVETAVKIAIDGGYRHFDCAFIYGNEAEVGSAIREKIAEGAVKREDLFIVSKLWNTRHQSEDVIPSLKESLELLGLDYLDLYLVHWPLAFKSGKENFPKNAEGELMYEDVDLMLNWKAMEECVDSGLSKAIGLSNYNSEQIKTLLDEARIKPTVNQIEIHPYFSQEKLVKYCQDRGVAVIAFSPLGSAARPWATAGEPLLVEEPALKAIGEKYSKSSAQVIIRWLVQRNIIVIPKSVNPGRIAENFNVFDFELSAEDMKAVSAFNKDARLIVPRITINGKQVLRDAGAPNFPFNIEF